MQDKTMILLFTHPKHILLKLPTSLKIIQKPLKNQFAINKQTTWTIPLAFIVHSLIPRFHIISRSMNC